MMTNDKEPEAISRNEAEAKAIEAQARLVAARKKEITPGRNLLITLGFVFVGFFVGQFVASMVTIILAFLNGMGMEEMGANPNAIYDYLNLTEVLSSQMLYTLVFTFITPWFYLRLVANKSIASLSSQSQFNPLMLVITVLSTVAFMFVNAYLVEWNQAWTFPEFMSGFEEWARNLEEVAAAATERFTTFDNFGEFLIGFIAIAVLPGIGEELLFRGVLQNSLQRWTKNHHVAIWVAAFIFSAIHLQLFGLVPRMALGAIFGYLYYWSGNLWYPIIAHATNNGLAVILTYLATTGVIEMDIDETENIPFYYSAIGLVVFTLLFVVFRNYYIRQKLKSE